MTKNKKEISVVSDDVINKNFDKWKNMPNPKPLSMVSWQDVYSKALEMGYNPTREQVIEIFDSIDRNDFDCEFGTFWSTVEEAVRGCLGENEDDEEEEE